jgi:SDR family mycofactocin-dependent oxidoreductase
MVRGSSAGRLEGRVSVVTGAARGQGRSHAVALAREGAAVVACDLAEPIATVPYELATPADLDETVRRAAEAGRGVNGPGALAVKADVRSSADMRRVVATALEEFGRVDHLVANAGICSYATLAAMTDEIWQDTIDVNLTGCANAIRAVVGPMTAQGFGRIVVTASGAARTGMQNLSHYSASKWGVVGLVKSAALELGAHGITVNAVLPATVETDMVVHEAAFRLFRPHLEHPTVEDLQAVLRTFNPMGVPWVQPEDITRAVLFLLEDDARYVSGATIDVSAGASAKYQ